MMHLIEKEFKIPVTIEPLISYFRNQVNGSMYKKTPIRFAVTSIDSETYFCEVGFLISNKKIGSIFEFKKRNYENQDTFNAIMIVPTGIDAEIGGHAGDACPTAKLLAAVCDKLIIHPNIVNASDINEMPENSLYVEGSVISDLLMGTCGITKTRSNKIILVIDKHHDSKIRNATINTVSAARATMGIDCRIVEIDPIIMKSKYSSSGTAIGEVEGLEKICKVLDKYEGSYDAIAISSVIDVPLSYHTKYFEEEMVNPWGGVEAMLTHAISKIYHVPVAHSPMISTKIMNLDMGIIDPRKSAEAVSMCFLYCILKGLHKSPRIIRDRTLFPEVMTAENISCLVVPEGCIGLPTLAAMEQGIPIIEVKNKNLMKNQLFETIKVDNYLEAAGVMAALKTGITLESIRRPLKHTEVNDG